MSSYATDYLSFDFNPVFDFAAKQANKIENGNGECAKETTTRP